MIFDPTPWPGLLKAFKEWDNRGLVGCSREEYCILFNLALLNETKDVLELGSGAGGSTEAMLMALRGKEEYSLTSVDINDSGLPVVTDRTNLIFCQCKTDDFFAQNTNKYDLIFVDACHTDAQSDRDIENSLKACTLHGIVACHDLLNGKEETDIKHHVVKLSGKYGKKCELITKYGNGLGIIY